MHAFTGIKIVTASLHHKRRLTGYLKSLSPSISDPRSTRTTTPVTQWELCIFCQIPEKAAELRTVTSPQMSDKILSVCLISQLIRNYLTAYPT